MTQNSADKCTEEIAGDNSNCGGCISSSDPVTTMMRKSPSWHVSSGLKEDWEKARDWLANERVTKMSAKVPSLAEIRDEEGLYNYLKDGTELCRVIGIVTRGHLLEGITYRSA